MQILGIAIVGGMSLLASLDSALAADGRCVDAQQRYGAACNQDASCVVSRFPGYFQYCESDSITRALAKSKEMFDTEYTTYKQIGK